MVNSSETLVPLKIEHPKRTDTGAQNSLNLPRCGSVKAPGPKEGSPRRAGRRRRSRYGEAVANSRRGPGRVTVGAYPFLRRAFIELLAPSQKRGQLQNSDCSRKWIRSCDESDCAARPCQPIMPQHGSMIAKGCRYLRSNMLCTEAFVLEYPC